MVIKYAYSSWRIVKDMPTLFLCHFGSREKLVLCRNKLVITSKNVDLTVIRQERSRKWQKKW